MYTLVICEKPDAARRIAQALGNSSETRRAGIPVYDVTRGETRYIVASAIGHLYGLTDVTASRSVFPVLDLEWAPVAKNARAAKAIGVIAGLAKAASEFVHACDYDQEGEVIGYSILEYACKGKYSGSRRAKFSTLTDDEIKSAFAGTIAPSGGLAAAGRSRHMLDFLYGINLSRALSQSFKSTRGGYRSLSIGRVQGPALAFVYDREGEIRLHIPDPYWKIDALLEGGGEKFTARYSERRVGALAEAREIRDACAHRAGTVSEIETRKVVLHPPTPFNTGDLQQEAYRLFKLSPGYTLAIAEKLYLRALISYPRTSSQKLPQEIGYERIISALSSVPAYSEAARILLSRGRLTPNQGRMSDPAHPAIYPTGVAPRSRLSGLEFKVYDLIVRRFFATFGDPAFSQRTAVAIDIAGYRFDAEGVAISSEGWMSLYRPYVSLERRSLPTMRHGDLLENHGIGMHEEFTQPPRRYNQASLLAKMAGFRLPIQSHPLQAAVSEPVKPVLDTVVMSGAVHVYVSQSDKGELVLGAGIDGYNSYAQRGSPKIVEDMFGALVELFPIFSRLKVLRTWGGIVDVCPDASPIIGKTPVEGLFFNCGWGTGGFKATPGSGWVFAYTIANDRPHPLNEAFTLERFSGGRLIDEHGAAAVAH